MDPPPPVRLEAVDVADERLARYLSPLLRPLLGTGAPQYVHRAAAVEFATVRGIDRVALADGPASAFARLQAVAKTVQGAVADCGVCVI